MRREHGQAWSKDEWDVFRARSWRTACKRAGLAPTPRPYDLRHSFASLLLAEGRTVHYVAAQLGHSPALTLSTYGHLIAEYADAGTIDAEREIVQARTAVRDEAAVDGRVARDLRRRRTAIQGRSWRWSASERTRSPRNEIPDATRALECVQCKERYPVAEAYDLGEPLTCETCGSVGFIPRRRERIADKFPGDLGEHFTAVPDRLFDASNGLGLTPAQLLVVIALETFRWGADDVVYPSQERIAAMTRQSRRTVQRALDGLASAGLLTVHHARHAGHYGRNEYDLAPLWTRLAKL